MNLWHVATLARLVAVETSGFGLLNEGRDAARQLGEPTFTGDHGPRIKTRKNEQRSNNDRKRRRLAQSEMSLFEFRENSNH